MASFSSKNFSSGKLRKSSIDLGEKGKKNNIIDLYSQKVVSEKLNTQTQKGSMALQMEVFTRKSTLWYVKLQEMETSLQTMSHFFNNYVSSTFCCGEIKSVERIYFLCKHKPQTRTANSSKHFVVL